MRDSETFSVNLSVAILLLAYSFGCGFALMLTILSK